MRPNIEAPKRMSDAIFRRDDRRNFPTGRGTRKGLTLRDHRRARPPYRIEEEV